jgi:hypothetical protein
VQVRSLPAGVRPGARRYRGLAQGHDATSLAQDITRRQRSPNPHDPHDSQIEGLTIHAVERIEEALDIVRQMPRRVQT